MPRRRRVLLGAVLTAALLTGCSSDEPGDPVSPFSQNDDVVPDPDDIRDGLAGLYAPDDADDTDGTAGACFAEALLAAVGIDDLADAEVVGDDGRVVDVLPRRLDEATARAWVAAHRSCSPEADRDRSDDELVAVLTG